MASARTINLPGSGSATEQYELAPGLLQYVQSVYIEVDNTAGGAARPTLTLSEQSGVVIAKKRQGESIPAGSSGSATWALRLTDETSASSAATLPFASYITNVSTAVPNNTNTVVGFGNALGIYTNRSDIFAIDLNAGKYGVGIHAAGFYMMQWTVSLFDRAGHRIPTPEVEQVYAEDGSALELLSGMFLGSNYVYGYHHPGGGGGFAEWDVVWSRTIGVASSTATAPIIANVAQHTGQTLDAYAYVQVTQLDPTNLV